MTPWTLRAGTRYKERYSHHYQRYVHVWPADSEPLDVRAENKLEYIRRGKRPVYKPPPL